jgi:hypothetical protein
MLYRSVVATYGRGMRQEFKDTAQGCVHINIFIVYLRYEWHLVKCPSPINSHGITRKTRKEKPIFRVFPCDSVAIGV